MYIRIEHIRGIHREDIPFLTDAGIQCHDDLCELENNIPKSSKSSIKPQLSSQKLKRYTTLAAEIKQLELDFQNRVQGGFLVFVENEAPPPFGEH